MFHSESNLTPQPSLMLLPLLFPPATSNSLSAPFISTSFTSKSLSYLISLLPILSFFLSISLLAFNPPKFPFFYFFLPLMSYHRDQRIELDMKDLVGVLWACTKAHVSAQTNFVHSIILYSTA